VLILCIYTVGLDAPLSNYDEPLYAEFIRSMHEQGALGLVYRGVFTWQRPPTAVWLYAMVSGAIDGEFGLRLLPALCTAASALASGLVVWKRFGSAPAGIATAAFCAGIPSSLLYGRMLLSDPPFVLLCVAALAATMAAQEQPKWFLWAALALGGTFAVKSMAGAIPTAALAPWLWAAARRYRGDRSLRAVAALLGMGAMAGAFYAIGFIADGAQFFHDHFAINVVSRARGELADGELGIGIGGPAAYVEHLFCADGVMWALLLIGGVIGAAITAARRRDLQLGVAASSAVVQLSLLSLFGTRLAHYLLPFYPFAAIAGGGLLARLLAAREGRWYGIASVSGAIALLFSGMARPGFDAGADPSFASRDLGQAAAHRLAAGEPVFTYDWYAPAVGYYADRPWRFLTGSARAARLVQVSELFARSGVVRVAPPWPARRFLVAGDRVALARAPGLHLAELVAESGEFVLAVAEAP
jgi:4-amino-4-deoxy-L-arabinose transferase-like glycosyltransferase